MDAPQFLRIRTGDQVIIRAKDDFFAYVDGWYGRVCGWNNSLAEVRCSTADGQKTFFIPPEQLELNIRGGGNG